MVVSFRGKTKINYDVSLRSTLRPTVCFFMEESIKMTVDNGRSAVYEDRDCVQYCPMMSTGRYRRASASSGSQTS